MVMVGRTHEVDHVPVQVTLAPTLTFFARKTARRSHMTRHVHHVRLPPAMMFDATIICMYVARPHMSASLKPLPCTQGCFVERHMSDIFGIL